MKTILQIISILFLFSCGKECVKPDVEFSLDTSNDYRIIIDGKDAGLLDDKYNKIELQDKDSITIVIKKVQ